MGNNKSVNVLDMVKIIEKEVGFESIIKHEPADRADVDETFADIRHSSRKINFQPKTNIEEGIQIHKLV